MHEVSLWSLHMHTAAQQHMQETGKWHTWYGFQHVRHSIGVHVS